MDGDRSVVDGRDIFESELQRLVRVAFEIGWDFRNECMPNPECSMYAELEEAYRMFDEKIHELVVSHYDSAASDVGSEDETAQTSCMGDGFR